MCSSCINIYCHSFLTNGIQYSPVTSTVKSMYILFLIITQKVTAIQSLVLFFSSHAHRFVLETNVHLNGNEQSAKPTSPHKLSTWLIRQCWLSVAQQVDALGTTTETRLKLWSTWCHYTWVSSMHVLPVRVQQEAEGH